MNFDFLKCAFESWDLVEDEETCCKTKWTAVKSFRSSEWYTYQILTKNEEQITFWGIIITLTGKVIGPLAVAVAP